MTTPRTKPAGSRHKRPRPQRAGPIRNPMAKVSNTGAPPEPPSDPRPEARPGATLGDALECGVRTAYTVIDEYLRRGFEAARGNRDSPSGRGDMRDENPNFSSWTNPWGSMAAPMQMWVSGMRAWAEMWAPFLPGGASQQMWNMGGWPGFPTGASQVPALSIQVVSHRAAGVTASVHLLPGFECAPLMVGPLAGEGSEPPLNRVSIDTAPGALRIHVPVPADQPVGTYHGSLTTADGRVAGRLTVVISDVSSARQ